MLYFLKAWGSRNSNMTSGEDKDMDMGMVDMDMMSLMSTIPVFYSERS